MIKFLFGADIAKSLSGCLKESGPTDLAVAYWGKRGADRIGLGRTHKSVRVLCDLRSLSCNPDELLTLLNYKFELKTLDRLHAKVYIVGDRTIVGSANASSNGLGQEDSELDLKLMLRPLAQAIIGERFRNLRNGSGDATGNGSRNPPGVSKP